jgi:hypothetical protein
VVIAKYVQAGANAPLDQSLAALGRLGRHCAPPVLDALAEWRAPKQREADVEIAKLRRYTAPSPLPRRCHDAMPEGGAEAEAWGGRGAPPRWAAWTRRLAR